MKIEEIRTAELETIEQRAAEIAEAVGAACDAELVAFAEELTAIEERKAVIEKEAAEKRAAIEEVRKAAEVIEKPEQEERKMSNMEIRNSAAYIDAFAKYIKTGKDAECRTLLSDNVQNGVIPVPAFVGEIVAARLEESEILRRVRKMEAAGNVKIGFEISAPAAEAHMEGGDPVTEEALVLGIVTLVPVAYKKWVQVSDEALDTMSGEAFLRYIYDEVARGIIKAEEDEVVAAILAAPQTATSTDPAVAKTGTAPAAIADFVNARALLSSAARDLVIIVTPAQYAQYRALQMSASYAVDPFDGLEVLFNDTVNAPIIGDLSGVLMNLPRGEEIQFKYDDTSEMTSDLVRILGRQPAAIGLVGNKYFAKVAQ